MFTFQATGYLVNKPKLISSFTKNSFYSFTLSVKKRGTKNKEPCRVYVNCTMDQSKKNVAEIMTAGKQVFVSGLIYDLDTYFSEPKQENLINTKANIFHVELLNLGGKKEGEEFKEKQEIQEEDNAWTV